MTWLWARRRPPEPVDAIAARLDMVADQLDEATAELRELVDGLRPFGNIDGSENR